MLITCRYGRLRVIWLSSLATAAMVVVLLVSPNFAVIIIARSVMGLFATSVLSTAVALGKFYSYSTYYNIRYLM